MYWAATTVRVRASGPPPPPVVEVAPVVQRTVPVIGEWVGTTEGYVNAQIQPQVSGYLIRQDYREGAYVKKGRVLFEIDPRPFQAALDQAKGQLAQAEAQVANADLNVKRDIPEAEAHAIPQGQLDTDSRVAQIQLSLFDCRLIGLDCCLRPAERLRVGIKLTLGDGVSFRLRNVALYVQVSVGHLRLLLCQLPFSLIERCLEWAGVDLKKNST